MRVEKSGGPEFAAQAHGPKTVPSVFDGITVLRCVQSPAVTVQKGHLESEATTNFVARLVQSRTTEPATGNNHSVNAARSLNINHQDL